MAIVEANPIAATKPPMTWRSLSMQDVAWVLACVMVSTLGLHGWPVGASAQLFWPASILMVLWFAVVLAWSFMRGGRRTLSRAIPPTCVWLFLVVCVLSIAATDTPARAAMAAGKIVLSVLSVYTLLAVGAHSTHRQERVLLLLAATAGAVLLLGLRQWIADRPVCGLFQSPLKLGTFLAATVPMAWTTLAGSPSRLCRVSAVTLVTAALLICPSVWAIAGILVGVVLGTAIGPGTRWQFVILCVTAVAAIGVASSQGRMAALLADARLREVDSQDLRQRYIEWQATLNLLTDRAGAGTGVGCLNDHRSEYYLRLPKRNTIAAFDQNGWLATAGETGFVGLLALCWAFGRYIRRAWQQRQSLVARAALAGLVALIPANAASSLQYAGILPLWVILLVLIDTASARNQEV